MAKKTNRKDPVAVQELKHPWLVPLLGCVYLILTCMMFQGETKLITLLLILSAIGCVVVRGGTLAKRLHMDAQAVEEHLAALTGVHILNSYPLELENGIVNAYIICNNESLIPLLYFARILCQNDTYYINWRDRQSPLLRRGEEAKKEETAHENRKK